MPPLRQRGDDLLLLIDHFLAAANRDHGQEVRGVSPEAMTVLRRYSWPGNVRELQSVIRQAVLDTTGPVLFPDALPQIVHDDTLSVTAEVASDPVATDSWSRYIQERLDAGSETIYDDAIQALEQQLITQVLRATRGNQGEAAKKLGITRTTLRTKIKSLGISIDRVVSSEAIAAPFESADE